MKHIMYAFTGTGNTLHIAKLVENSIAEDNVIIKPINGKIDKDDVEAMNADAIIK